MLHRLLNALILLPDRYCYQVPAELGLSADAVAFPNAQGHLLRGFLFQPVGQTGAPSLRRGEAPIVLFCPGTSGNLSSQLPMKLGTDLSLALRTRPIGFSRQ